MFRSGASSSSSSSSSKSSPISSPPAAPPSPHPATAFPASTTLTHAASSIRIEYFANSVSISPYTRCVDPGKAMSRTIALPILKTDSTSNKYTPTSVTRSDRIQKGR